MTLLIKAVASIMTTFVARNSVLILKYHRVLDTEDTLFSDITTLAEFDAQMSYVRNAFNVISLSEAVEKLRKGTLPPRAIVITFDDGYADNVTNALPVLLKYQLPATFFIATGFLNGGIMWNDQIIESIRTTSLDELDLRSVDIGVVDCSTLGKRKAAIEKIIANMKYLELAERLDKVQEVVENTKSTLPKNLMMTDAQVVELHKSGMTVGGHTVNHPILTSIPKIKAEKEISAGKEYLESLIGDRVNLFAYPNGKPKQDYNRDHINILRSLNFDAAVSTAWGSVNNKDDVYQLPRLLPWDKNMFMFAARLAKSYVNSDANRV